MRCGGAHPVRGKMPAFMRKSLLLSALLLILGCDIASTMRGAIDSWKGAPLDAAVHQWGSPLKNIAGVANALSLGQGSLAAFFLPSPLARSPQELAVSVRYK